MSLTTQLTQNTSDISITIFFGHGSFEKGFPVRIRLIKREGEENRSSESRVTPPATEISRLYAEWKSLYEKQARVRSRVISIPSQTTQRSLVNECRCAADDLERELNEKWFKKQEFRNALHQGWIEGRINDQEDKSIPVVFEFDTGDKEIDSLLKRLPWHKWDLFKRLESLEPTIRTAYRVEAKEFNSPIEILAIYGSDEGGLDLEEDEKAMEALEAAGAKLTSSRTPNREELHRLLTQKSKNWDILFFGGHSFSNEDLSAGYLQIGQSQSNQVDNHQQDQGYDRHQKGIYHLDELRDDLRSASQRGIKIAIFNSCDGLGIANYITQELRIPCAIVFKEAVPDKVAREFLKEFLMEFRDGTPLYLSVRKARASISWMESDANDPFPCASWLPVVCQDPEYPELTWSNLEDTKEPDTPPKEPDTPREEPDIPPKEPDIPPVNPPIRLQKWMLYLGLGLLGLLGALGLSQVIPWGGEQKQPSPLPGVTISTGEETIDTGRMSSAKDDGAAATSQSPPNYDSAAAAFIETLNGNPDDPESWIYLNNAIAESQASSLDVVEVAVVIPTNILGVSREVLRGVAQGQSEFNCGIGEIASAVDAQTMPNCNGTSGKMLKIYIAGSENALPAAQSISQIDSIVAVIGHFSSTDSLQAAPEYAKENLVAISPISTSVKLSQYRNFLRTPPSDAIAAEYLAEYATEQLGVEKVALANIPDGTSAFSISFAEEFRNNLPSEAYVYEEGSCDLTLGIDFDADQCVADAMAAGAEAILMVPDTAPQLEIALELAEVDEDIILLGGDSVYNPRTLDKDGIYDKQLTVAVPWYRSDSEFEEDASQLYPNLSINWRSAMAYEASKVIGGVVSQLSGVPSREEFLTQLNEMRDEGFGDGVVGNIRFDENGDRIRDAQLADDGLGVLVTVDETGNFVRVD